MVQSLFNLCLSAVCQHELSDDLALMPGECKQRLLQFFDSHDQFATLDCDRLVSSPLFGTNLNELTFFLSADLTDTILYALTLTNKRLDKITLVECRKITDAGVRAATRGQKDICQLELRAMSQLTDDALEEIHSPLLHSVDLSGCRSITSEGLRSLISRHPNIRCLYLNHCRALDDRALYYIAHFVGERLQTLEMDFPSNLIDPASSLRHLSEHCPNISQLSIARFFNEVFDSTAAQPNIQYKIDGLNLRNVDLYANFFVSFPSLPLTVNSLRLSLNGEEDPVTLLTSLQLPPFLTSINLQLIVKEASITAIDNANALLATILPFLGTKITILQVSVPRLFDEALRNIVENTPNLTHLALEVNHLNTNLLQKYFAGGSRSRACRLRSIKICRMRITYRILFAIARGARSLVDLECSHMHSVDDRFVSLLGDNCRQLQSVNFNGCKWVSDKGMSHLARRCPLREVRMRGTACTDKSIYLLAQFCPDLEWISYADYSGRPKFTETALQCLRDSCIQRVIC